MPVDGLGESIRERSSAIGQGSVISPRVRITLVAVLVSLIPAAGCTDAAGCTPTTVDASPAARLDLGATRNSSTLEARLSVQGSGEPLSGRSLRFAVTDDGAEVADFDGSTGADGLARVDLKRADLAAVEALGRGDGFIASFSGDATYCSSADTAEFSVADPPGGPSVTTP